MTLAFTVVCERRGITCSFDIVGYHGYVETLALEAAFLVPWRLLRCDADGLVWNQRRLAMVAIEANLNLTSVVAC